MDLQKPISDLAEITALCSRLSGLLENKRQAMKAFALESMEALVMEEELLLEQLRCQDLDLKETLERLAGARGLTVAQWLARPEAARFRSARADADAAVAEVRRQALMTQKAAEHVVAFFRHWQASQAPTVSYASSLGASLGRAGYGRTGIMWS